MHKKYGVVCIIGLLGLVAFVYRMGSSDGFLTGEDTSQSINYIDMSDEVNVVNKKTALLANGCFWCVESDLDKVVGVIDVVSGYAGGTTENPTYENYASGGHREVVLVTYDADKVSFANLVEHIIKHGDPTDANGSFNDRGGRVCPGNLL